MSPKDINELESLIKTAFNNNSEFLAKFDYSNCGSFQQCDEIRGQNVAYLSVLEAIHIIKYGETK